MRAATPAGNVGCLTCPAARSARLATLTSPQRDMATQEQNMARTSFERQLSEIEEDMLVMAGMVERAIERSIEALKNRDIELARVVIVDDIEINTQALRDRGEVPRAARDAAADGAATCARSSPSCTSSSTSSAWATTRRASPRSRSCWRTSRRSSPTSTSRAWPRSPTRMLRAEPRGLQAARRRPGARDLRRRRRGRRALRPGLPRAARLHAQRPASTIERATHITWIAHNLERIADRVTNICERVVYMVQGTSRS